MSFDALMDKSAVLQREVKAAGTSAEVTRTFPAILRNVPVAVLPLSWTVRNAYSSGERQMDVTHKVYTTTDLRGTRGLDGKIIGGLKLGDRFLVGGEIYLVQDFLVQENAAVSSETVFTAVCQVVSA